MKKARFFYSTSPSPGGARPSPNPRGGLRRVLVGTAALSLALTGAQAVGVVDTPTAEAATYAIQLDGDDILADNVNGLTFKGFGVLSANSTSAVLMDYKSEQPAAYAQLLQTLFGGENPIMDHVKIEMGNDRNTSTGPNPSTMRWAAEAANPARDPGFQLAADAKRINPDLKVSILRWREPAWTGNRAEDNYIWFKNTALAAYRTYGYMIDYLNPGRNEESYNASNTITWAGWIKSDTTGYVSDDPALAGFKDATEQALFQQIKIIIDDSVGLSTAGPTLTGTSSALRDAVDVAAYHYTTNDDSSNSFKKFALNFDKEVWNSEAQATFSNSAFRPNNNVQDPSSADPGTELGGTNSALEMANTIVKGFVNSHRSHFVYQPAIGSFYEGGQYSHKELVSARDPWSGWIHYDAGLDILRHFTDFATTGWENSTNTAGVWRAVPQASASTATGTNPVVGRDGGRNYMTLGAPDKSAFSTVIVNDSTYAHTYNLSFTDMDIEDGAELEVWETRAAADGQVFNANYLKHIADVTPDEAGVYTIAVKPWSIVTVTSLDKSDDPEANRVLPVEGERTVLDQSAGVSATSGPTVLYSDDFEYGDKTVPVFDADGEPTAETESFIDSRGGPTGADPLYTWDRNGAFEAVQEDDGSFVLRQQLDTAAYGVGSAWNGGDPITGIGDSRWVNYKVSVDVRFDRDTVEGSANYAAVGARSTGGDNSQNLSSTPYVLRLNRSGDWLLQRFGATQRSGTIELESGAWTNLGLEVAGNTVTAYLDGQAVGSFTDSSPVMSGRIDLASGFHFTSFDNLVVEKLPTYTPYYLERLDGMEMTDLASPPNTKLVYGGSWLHTNGQSMYAYGRSLSTSQAVGATVSYTFDGTGLDVMGPGNSSTLRVTLDGVVIVPSVKAVATGSPFYRTTYTLRGLPQGTHTVTLEVLAGTLVVDSFDTVGPLPAVAPDTAAIAQALANTAGVVQTEAFTEATWATFQTVKAHASAAVADPVAYGLDSEGVTQVAKRLEAAALPGAWTLPEVTAATSVGVAPVLPATLTGTNADDESTMTMPITWDLAGASFDTAWQTVTVKGAYMGVDTSARVEVVPANLLYFADVNGVASGLGAGTSSLGHVSPTYLTVAAWAEAAGSPLLNSVADQRMTGDATWGHQTYSNATTVTTPNYKGVMAGAYSKTTTTGVYSSNAVGSQIRYTFTVAEPGAYVVAFDSYTWWAGTGRTTQVYIDYAGGPTTSLAQFSLNTTTDLYHGEFVVNLAEAGTVTLRLVAVSAAQSPLLSWAALSQADVQSVAVTPEEASVTVGQSESFDAVVTYSSGATDGAVDWSVAGATSEGTTLVDGLLQVGADEQATTLTVTAVAKSDPTKSAQAEVTVVRPLKLTATATSRCVAGKAILTVVATNGEQVPIAVQIVTALGQKSNPALAAGGKLTATSPTGAASITAGQATVSGSAEVGGETRTATVQVPYAGGTCG